ncbi:TetR/AcrR family transcriptional regulator [Afipia sp. P52-10]|uniref:TetR/AcrR family transcriptional regulator n=1 Tax=Afipia sp. P52-10 TaxID=1429916 RepID=UPI0013631469|nr:TetR/AcrR family transcriptional regulator [Afipia sp. P52-10]
MAVAQRKTEVGRTHAERRREAETRIVQAAFDIVAKRGVDQLTLAEAGEEAGYSRALPAHYFGNRDVLLAAVAEHAVNQYRRRVVEKNLPTAAGLEPILTGIAFYLDDSRSWPKRLKAFHEVTNAALRWPLIAEVTAKLNREQVERFAQQIRAAQALGEIRADIDPVAEAITVSGTIRGIMAQWLVAPDSIDLDAVRDGFIAGLRRNWAA